MKFSIGVFAKHLIECSNHEETQRDIVMGIMESVAPNREYSVDDKYIQRLIRCEHKLGAEKPPDLGAISFYHLRALAREVEFDVLVKRFNEKIFPKIKSDMRVCLFGKLKSNINNDSTIVEFIRQNSEKDITSILSCCYDDVSFVELLVAIFLYSLLSAENTEGRGCDCKDEDCPVLKAIKKANRYHDQDHNVKPEYAKEIDEAVASCGKDCVLRITEADIRQYGDSGSEGCKPGDGKKEDATGIGTTINVSGDYVLGTKVGGDYIANGGFKILGDYIAPGGTK